MHAKGLTRHYDGLTPDERFQLIAAAGQRGDDAEQIRLISAGGVTTLSMRDHVPFARAFDNLAPLVYLELWMKPTAIWTPSSVPMAPKSWR